MYDPDAERITLSKNFIFNEQKNPEINKNTSQICICDDEENIQATEELIETNNSNQNTSE